GRLSWIAWLTAAGRLDLSRSRLPCPAPAMAAISSATAAPTVTLARVIRYPPYIIASEPHVRALGYQRSFAAASAGTEVWFGPSSSRSTRPGNPPASKHLKERPHVSTAYQATAAQQADD